MRPEEPSGTCWCLSPPQAARDLAVREVRGTGPSGAGRAPPTEGRRTTPGGGGRGVVAVSVERDGGDDLVQPARECTMPDCRRAAVDPGRPGALCPVHRPGDGPESRQSQPLLDSHRESRTRGDTRDSSRLPEDGDSGIADEADESPDESASSSADDRRSWNRQQKRTFHRVHTMLSYWEQHDYQIRWVTLTSSEDSDDADRLAYNHRRLRQTIERASLARDADGEGHRLDHVREIESLVIRTCEGPEGKGVLHLFWAWKPPEGQHSLDFYVPHDWLSRQWGRIHGPHDEHSEKAAQPLHVWIERVGGVDYHSRESLAGYCVSQYLGEHGEALENVSWSWERTLGGSVTEAWQTVRNMTESLDAAKDVWHRVLGGERVSLSSPSEYVDYGKVVKPPPDLGVLVERSVTVTPPDGYRPAGPNRDTIRRSRPAMPEYEGGGCPECERGHVYELRADHELVQGDATDRAAYQCVACKTVFAESGEGESVAPDQRVGWRWRHRPIGEPWRQSRLGEFE